MFHIAWHEYKIFLIAKRSYLFSIHVFVFGCHFVATFYDVWFLGILDENTNWKHHQWNTIFTFRAINFLLVPKFTTNFDHKIYVNYWNAKSNRMQKKTLSNCISIFAKLIARSKEWYYTNIRLSKQSKYPWCHLPSIFVLERSTLSKQCFEVILTTFQSGLFK